jgi:magnesium transporter
MELTRELAERLMRAHPERAAWVLEKHDASAAAALLAQGEPEEAAEVLRRLSPQRAGQILALLARSRAAALLAQLGLDQAVRLVRRLPEEVRTELLQHFDPRRARAIGALLAFPEGTAGALMDPEVLALPRSLGAREALDRIRAEPEHARYNLYVLDEEQCLVGVLNLRELLLAPPSDTLGDLMRADPLRLEATADRSRVVSHPGWREVHSLPVVDERGCYLGAIRYHTLRELEEALLSTRHREQSTSVALGELFAAGAAGLFEALGGGAAAGTGAQRGR